jgi:hypothetical protein
MKFSPVLLLHICTGVLGCLSGFVAVFLRKGSRRHSIAGRVFVVSMLIMSASGTYLAITVPGQRGNVTGGVLTFYLVATAWMTARRNTGGTGIFEWGALLAALAIEAITLTWGTQAAMSSTGLKYGYPPGPYFFLSFVGLIAIVGDVRLLVRGGISGVQRLARHLWRMCFAFFIAAASIFLARAQVFPVVMRRTGILFLLSFLPLILMMFWLVRVRFTKAYKNARPGFEASGVGGLLRQP